jgi:predicted Fe-S protein YdhL (DUF1289 family)
MNEFYDTAEVTVWPDSLSEEERQEFLDRVERRSAREAQDDVPASLPTLTSRLGENALVEILER